ncbi:MAG TPA: Gp37 family protein [Candidatus Binataceae bacterium]|nr:Gp37 family protein [Candidatus Binataceae bacterium]
MAAILDSPWAGQIFNPPTPLDISTIEAAIVSQLQTYVASALGTQMIEVTHFPDNPEAYEMRHRIGVAMVIYMGGNYGAVLDIGNVAQERTMEFAVGIRIRDLGWAYGGPPSGTSPGAYQVLETIRLALTGFQPNSGCTRMNPIRERFIKRDKQGGVWIYEMVFATRAVSVENYQPSNFPLFIHGTAQEEGAVTTIQVGAELFAFNGTPGTITLVQGNLSKVTIMSQNLAITYMLNTDYSVDAVNGIVTRIASGSIPANATVALSYAYNDVTTALAGGGNAPFAPTN